MRLDPDETRRRFADARVARLATVTADGAAHLVPICFAVVGRKVFSAVDDKPKTSTALRRLDNVRAHDRVSLLVDHYDEDWKTLWWVRADGLARVVYDGQTHERGVVALRAKYAQYAAHALDGAVLAVDVKSWTGWAAGTSPARER